MGSGFGDLTIIDRARALDRRRGRPNTWVPLTFADDLDATHPVN